MTQIDIIGYAAAILTTAAFIPQTWLVLKTRNTDGLSLLMYIAFTGGVTLWLIYGTLTRAWPLAIANLLTLFMALMILSVLILNKRKASLSPRD